MQKIIYAVLLTQNSLELVNSFLMTIKGILNQDLYPITCNGIYAVVGKIKKDDLIADRSQIIEYANVIEKLAWEFTLLPMRYGSVMDSDDSIRNMLKRNKKEIVQNLKKVENKNEFGLKIFYDFDKLKSELSSEPEDVTEEKLKTATAKKNSVYKDYVNMKLKEHRDKELVLNFINKPISEIKEYLDKLNAIAKFKKMLDPTNIIDAVFLLDKSRKGELVELVKNLQNKYTSLNFVLTGPWPPYNFVSISIK